MAEQYFLMVDVMQAVNMTGAVSKENPEHEVDSWHKVTNTWLSNTVDFFIRRMWMLKSTNRTSVECRWQVPTLTYFKVIAINFTVFT